MRTMDALKSAIESCHSKKIDKPNKEGFTLLTEAVQHGSLDLVCFLLQKGANINACNQDHSTALFFAASMGHGELVYFLLDRGANVSIHDKADHSASSRAAHNGHHKIAQLIELYHGIDIHETPVMRAIRLHYEDMVFLLLIKSQDLNLKNKEGNTALMLAAYYGHKHIVLWLLEKNVDMHMQNLVGHSALDIAMQRGHTEIAQLLKQYRAVSLGDGYTPLMRAIKWGYEDIIALLLAKSDHIHAQTPQGNTAALLAAQYGRENVLRDLLLKNKIDMHAKNKKGDTMLSLAAEHKHYHIVWLLMTLGVDLDIKHYKNKKAIRQLIRRYNKIGSEITINRESPLMRAVKLGYLDLTYLWLVKYQNINLRNEKNETPLMISIERGSTQITQALIENGADVHLVDHHNKSALSRASSQWFRRKEVVLLIKAGISIEAGSVEARSLQARMIPLLYSFLDQGDLPSALKVFDLCASTYKNTPLPTVAQSVLKTYFLEVPKYHFIKKCYHKIRDFIFSKQATQRAAAKIGFLGTEKERVAYETLLSHVISQAPPAYHKAWIDTVVAQSDPVSRDRLRQVLYFKGEFPKGDAPSIESQKAQKLQVAGILGRNTEYRKNLSHWGFALKLKKPHFL